MEDNTRTLQHAIKEITTAINTMKVTQAINARYTFRDATIISISDK